MIEQLAYPTIILITVLLINFRAGQYLNREDDTDRFNQIEKRLKEVNDRISAINLKMGFKNEDRTSH